MAIRNNERLWTTYIVKDSPTYCITSNNDRSTYYLYEYKDNEFVKTIHKSDNPMELEKFIKNEKVVENKSVTEHKSTKETKNESVKETTKSTTKTRQTKTTTKSKLLKESVNTKSTKKGSLF